MQMRSKSRLLMAVNALHYSMQMPTKSSSLMDVINARSLSLIKLNYVTYSVHFVGLVVEYTFTTQPFLKDLSLKFV